MNEFKNFLSLASLFFLIQYPAFSENQHQIHITQHQDGSKTIFQREANQKTAIQLLFDKENELNSKKILYFNENNQIENSSIYNPKEEKLFEINYHYSPQGILLNKEIIPAQKIIPQN